MEFIKAQDLKTVANIMKALQKDVITSAMCGLTETQDKHLLIVDAKLVNVIEKYLIEAGYNVYLEQSKDVMGTPFTLIKLIWGE